ncbi:hypothetical protein QA649_34480 [Bradyrhizobium sp. CB1717]|uniref:hypothetical protein n=1 Tax=Bradyrhizobium sp. CB1717 TaxID=3039154 RepID=UPI0024B24CC5|nr:hypothetical protein [Bradyrhizobium sp. CB1717]WFU23150.1 hypothetical protein QA649_34480 [Bradyrhizobium sp. CB1717]
MEDDTLPLPADVEREFLERAGDGLTAAAWLQEHGVNPEQCGKAVLIDYVYIWNGGRYDFRIYPPDHVGPKRTALAVPVVENGRFVDLLVIGDDLSYETVCCKAPWLGRDNLKRSMVRLYWHPIDWIEAGCEGCCHIALKDRHSLKELRAIDVIECNDIATAFEAWEWGFGCDETELSRFVIDDTEAAVVRFFEDEARWLARNIAVELEGR